MTSLAKIESSPSSPFSILVLGAVRPGYPMIPMISPLLNGSCCFSKGTPPGVAS